MAHGDRTVDVLGHTMAYTERGQGDPIVLLHGNPTSSHLWRDVLPHLEDLGRCIAPDLIGMGNSDKLDPSGPETYRFVEHRRFLDSFLRSVGVTEHVTLVVHDWGSGLGLDWARRHADDVAGIVHMEAILDTLDSWQAWPESGRRIFEAMNSEDGEEICLEKNVFVERILPSSILRDLDDEEMRIYREPFREPGETRRPTLTWPRELPVAGRPPDVVRIIEDYRDWLLETDIPKLWVKADPGFLTDVFAGTAEDFPRQRTVTVPGLHFLQEDSPDEIGEAIATWYVDAVER